MLTLRFAHAEGLAFLDENGAVAPSRDACFHFENGEKREASLAVTDGSVRVEIPAGATHLSLGYGNVPCHNLYNAEGYLASPFLLALDEN